MVRTQQTILDLLANKEGKPEAISTEKRDEYMWDLWVITGVLEQGMRFSELESVKRCLIIEGRQPDFTFANITAQ